MHGNAIMKILLVNVLIYAVQSIFYLIAFFSGYKDEFLDFIRTWFGISSDLNVFITRPWTLFTNIVIHNPADIFHLLSNMLYLFFFGRIFIDFISQKNAWPLFITGGIIGSVVSIATYNLVPSLHDQIGIVGVGASAGVMAIVLAAATLVPNYSVSIIFIGPVKLKYIALLVVVIDLLSIPSEYNLGGHVAHLGGALTGYLFIRSYQSGRPWFEWWPKFENFIVRLFEKKKPKVVYVNRNPTPKKTTMGRDERDIDDQVKTDAILDKIKVGGYDSLSKAEKDFLFKISNKK
jgi:membrane associated rhomboid family serine protease